MCLILYLDAFDAFAVIAINLFISPDHFIASFRVSSVSSVVNDFDEIINSERLYLTKKEKSPFLTDLTYFTKAISNILLSGARSK